jgi:hypothetical protein
MPVLATTTKLVDSIVIKNVGSNSQSSSTPIDDYEYVSLVPKDEEKTDGESKALPTNSNFSLPKSMLRQLMKAPLGKVSFGKRALNKSYSKEIGQHYTCWLNITGLLTSDAGGLYNNAIPLDPSGYTDWADFAVLFDEYRLVSSELHIAQYVNGAANSTGAVIFAPDNDSVSAPGSLGGITEYQDCHLISFSIVRTEKMKFSRPDCTPSAYWTDAQTPNTTTCGAWKFNGAGFSASVAVFRYVHKMKVQFRMRV